MLYNITLSNMCFPVSKCLSSHWGNVTGGRHYSTSVMITLYLNLENSPRKHTRWLVENRVYITRWRHTTSTSCDVKAETHDATYRGDKSPRLHCCCNKSLALSLSLWYVARIQTSLNLCDRQNSVAATMIFTCHTRRFVAATCRSDVSQRFVALCVSAFSLPNFNALHCKLAKIALFLYSI